MMARCRTRSLRLGISPSLCLRFAFYLALLMIVTNPAVSQDSGPLLDFTSPNALPACARQCQPLLDAQFLCIPPRTPSTDQPTYQRCFCQSPALQTLYRSPAGLCDASCPPDQLNLVRNWFLSRCVQDGGITTTTITSTSSSASSTASQATVTAASPTSTPTTLTVDQPAPGGWWSSHWKWVVMVIVIALAMGGACIGGVWYKRYRRRKSAASIPQPVVWGPHQHQDFTRGYTHGAGTAQRRPAEMPIAPGRITREPRRPREPVMKETRP